MQLLSSYLCASAPLHHVPLCSISSTSVIQCRTLERAYCSFGLITNWRRGCGEKRGMQQVCAQSQEGYDNETVNVTDLRDREETAEGPAVEAGSSYMGGLSEEEIREALLFEQGGVEEGPRMGEADVSSGLYERTVPIPVNRGNGKAIVNIFTIFGGLLDRPFGSGASIAAAGSAVVERVQIEVEKLKEEDSVNEQLLFEVIRVVRLLEMDLKLISAAQKESTLLERVASARKLCQDGIVLANEL